MLGPTEAVIPFGCRGPPGADVAWLIAAPPAGVLMPCSAPQPQNFRTSATALACPDIPTDTPGAIAVPQAPLVNTEIFGSVKSTTTPTEASPPMAIPGPAAAPPPTASASPRCGASVPWAKDRRSSTRRRTEASVGGSSARLSSRAGSWTRLAPASSSAGVGSGMGEIEVPETRAVSMTHVRPVLTSVAETFVLSADPLWAFRMALLPGKLRTS